MMQVLLPAAFSVARPEVAALRYWAEPDLARAVAPVEAGICSALEARAEFVALASIHGEQTRMQPKLVRLVLVGMLDEVLPLNDRREKHPDRRMTKHRSHRQALA
jgi:hypothetical protein